MNLTINIGGNPASIELDPKEFLEVVANSPELRVAMQRMTREQIADHFQVTIRTVDRWKENNLIPFIKIGDVVRFDLFDVDAHVRDKHLIKAAA